MTLNHLKSLDPAMFPEETTRDCGCEPPLCCMDCIDPRLRIAPTSERARVAIDFRPEFQKAMEEYEQAMRDVVTAARCIKHWHDTANGGMIVSGEHVHKLWESLAKLDALTTI